jgi:putative peptidoglycan lipid II flippase
MKDTRTPVIAAFIAFLLNVGFSLALMGPLLHGGLALATTLSAFSNMLMLLYFLRKKIGCLGGRKIAVAGCKTALATIPMLITVAWGVRMIDWSISGQKLYKAAGLSVFVGGGIMLFLLFAYLFRCEETREALKIMRRRKL